MLTQYRGIKWNIESQDRITVSDSPRLHTALILKYSDYSTEYIFILDFTPPSQWLRLILWLAEHVNHVSPMLEPHAVCVL